MVPALSRSRTRLDLLESFPKGAVGAELGTFKGDFAAEILRICEPTLLHIVDRFEGVCESGDADGNNFDTIDMAAQEHIVRRRFYSVPVWVHKAASWDWLEALPSCWLDFVYIDTDHDYASTKRELSLCRRVVKPNGIIAGHDYSFRFFPGLVLAVNEFIKEHGLAMDVYRGDALPSFRIVNTSQ